MLYHFMLYLKYSVIYFSESKFNVLGTIMGTFSTLVEVGLSRVFFEEVTKFEKIEFDQICEIQTLG